MSQFKTMITTDGKHPAWKWGNLAADEIIEISEEAPTTLALEARTFRSKLADVLTLHHQKMMDHEQAEIASGKTDMDLPYQTEEYSEKVVDEIIALAKGLSFESHFLQDSVRQHLLGVCNRNFKSAKLVERSHWHSSNAQKVAPVMQKKGKKS